MTEPINQALAAHQKNLDNLRIQAAQHGIDVPVELQNAIDHEKKQIAELQQELDDRARGKRSPDDTEERIATLYSELAGLAMEAAGYGSKVPARLEQMMATKRAEIARLRRVANPNGRAEYQDFDARVEVLEHQVREVQSIITLILGRMNPTLRNRLLGIMATAFVVIGVGQWSIFEIRTFYLRDTTALALGAMVTIVAIVVSALIYIVRRYVAL